jgi:hypothetical protein
MYHKNGSLHYSPTIICTMARGKQQQEKKDGQHRKETKEERRARLQAEREAKEVRMSIVFHGCDTA